MLKSLSPPQGGDKRSPLRITLELKKTRTFWQVTIRVFFNNQETGESSSLTPNENIAFPVIFPSIICIRLIVTEANETGCFEHFFL
jgi:hypothetical protein